MVYKGCEWAQIRSKRLLNNNDAAIRWFVEKLVLAAASEPATDSKGNVVPIGATDVARQEAVEQYRVELPPKSRA